MIHFKIPFILLIGLLVCTLAWGGERQGPGNGNGNGNGMMNGFGRRGGMRGFQGGDDMGYGDMQRGNGRQSYGGQDSRKYRSNLYNDDDVYGYDATYPNGEAAYINYRSKDARTRRGKNYRKNGGPEFARTSRAYSRQGGGGERGMNYGQMNEYMGGGRGGGMW